MVSFHVFGLQECHFRRRKEKKTLHTQKKVGKSIGDPVRGRGAPNMKVIHEYLPLLDPILWKLGAKMYSIRI